MVRASAAQVAERLVAPRIGTRSPWSSKAGDILRRCGALAVRVERLLAYEISQFPVDAVGQAHDPMPQPVLHGQDDYARLLAHPQPAPLVHVPTSAESLTLANGELGLALSADEIDYLSAAGTTLADQMAWRSSCAHGWWGDVRPAPAEGGYSTLAHRAESLWDRGCAPHCR